MSTVKLRANAASRVVLLAFAGCCLYAMNSGIRDNYGILVNPVLDNSGISFASMGLVLAVGQLVFGLVQPLFGILAAKRGNTCVLLAGICLMMAGMALFPHCRSTHSLLLSMGVILPAGTGALSFGVIMGAITQKIPSKSVTTISGLVSASNGIGVTILAPIVISLIQSVGLPRAMLVLCIPAALMIPLALLLGRKGEGFSEAGAALPTLPETDGASVATLFKTAFRDRMYICLMAGFFTCGFHMALITNHLPPEILSHGFSSEAAAYAFSVYGITTIAGSVISGTLCGRFKMKNVLGFFYGMRPITILFFFHGAENPVFHNGVYRFAGTVRSRDSAAHIRIDRQVFRCKKPRDVVRSGLCRSSNRRILRSVARGNMFQRD